LGIAGWLFLALEGSEKIAPESVLGASTAVATAAPTPKPYPVALTTTEPVVRSNAYALYELESGKMLSSRAGTTPLAVASTTKLMTALIATRSGLLDTETVISDLAASQQPSSMELRRGERITLRNLLRGALLVSGNDAAYALGEEVGKHLNHGADAGSAGNVARFVQEMNITAQQLGLQDTRFNDPAGLDDTGHSTPLDLAKLTGEVLRMSEITSILQTPEMTVYSSNNGIRHDLRSSNRLVTEYLYSGALGGKTGYTEQAGHCLITAASRNGMTLVAVVLHTWSDTKDASALEVRKLLDWGFANYQLQ
jgi:D-alanyl-D-alanine carboxypeptidase